MNLKTAFIDANKAVQESSIFKYAKGVFYEDGLRTASREGALSDMEKNASDQYVQGLKDYGKGTKDYKDLKKAREQFSRTADSNYNAEDGISTEAYKGMSEADQKRLSRQAGVNATLNNPTPMTNADMAMGQYQKALKASKRERNVRTGIKMTKDYLVTPFTDGRIGTGAARAGAVLGGAGAVGAVTYSLTGGDSPDYSANYSSSSGNGTTQDF